MVILLNHRFFGDFRPGHALLNFGGLTLKAPTFYKNHKDQSFYPIRNHHKCFSYLILIHLNTYFMCLRSLLIFLH